MDIIERLRDYRLSTVLEAFWVRRVDESYNNWRDNLKGGTSDGPVVT
jgi:hypothetical protein